MCHGVAAGRLAEDRDLLRVASEGLDVVMDPPQRRNLIEEPEVPGACRAREITQDAQPVGHRHPDDALLTNEDRGVVIGGVSGAIHIGTTVNVDHDREGLPVSDVGGCVHRELLAVLVDAQPGERAGE